MTQKNRKNNSDRQSGRLKPAGKSNAAGVHAKNQGRAGSSYAVHPKHHFGFSVMNAGSSSISMSNGAGALSVPRGSVRDAGRYGDRLRSKKTYPNRRRKIITGKDLTTPLRRKKIVEKTQREKAGRRAEEKVRIKVRTVSAVKKKFPVSAIFCVFITAFFLLCLICSQIVLNEQNVEINKLNDEISAEIKKEKILENELDNKHDLNFIISYAVTELEMVKEDLLQKYYISGSLDDKVEVMEEKNGAIIDFPNIMSAIFKK